jgi:hypothetical protein
MLEEAYGKAERKKRVPMTILAAGDAMGLVHCESVPEGQINMSKSFVASRMQ